MFEWQEMPEVGPAIIEIQLDGDSIIEISTLNKDVCQYRRSVMFNDINQNGETQGSRALNERGGPVSG